MKRAADLVPGDRLLAVEGRKLLPVLIVQSVERVTVVGNYVDSVRIVFGPSSESTVDLRTEFEVAA